MQPSSKGMITGSLAQLLRYGIVQRAKNPGFNHRPQWCGGNCQYLYRITGKTLGDNREVSGGVENYREWLKWKKLPLAVQEILK